MSNAFSNTRIKSIVLFDAGADVELLRGAAIELHHSVHVGVEGLDHCCPVYVGNRSLGAPSRRRLSGQVKCLDEIKQSQGKGHMLLSVLLLELSNGKYHVYC